MGTIPTLGTKKLYLRAVKSTLKEKDVRLPESGVIAVAGDSMVASNMIEPTDISTLATKDDVGSPLQSTDNRLPITGVIAVAGDSMVASNMVAQPDNTSIGTILTNVNTAIENINTVLEAVNLKLNSEDYVLPDNLTIQTIKDYLENVSYGLNALNTSIGTRLASDDTRLDAIAEIKLNTEEIEAILNNNDVGLSALKIAITTHNDIIVDKNLDITFIKNCITNKKYMVKEGLVWYFIIRNSADTADILKKALKDKDNNNISDPHARIMTQELQSNV